MQRFVEGPESEAGATAIEYALIASLVSVGCIVGLLRFQESMGFLYRIIDAIADVIA